MSIRRKIRKVFWRLGYDVSRFSPTSHPLARRKALVEAFSIGTLLDVGANRGAFAQEMRDDLQYTEQIVSFEPLREAFAALQRSTNEDDRWLAVNYALGNENCEQEINIAGNSYSSSFLEMLPRHVDAAPESKYTGKEIVQIRTLDSTFSDFCTPSDNIYLKIDAQGFESKILEGAESSLQHIDTIQMEMSLVSLYEGELLFTQLCDLLFEKKYSLVSVEPVFTDRHSGQLLQVDGIFHRF